MNKQEKTQTHSLNFNSFSDVGSSVFFFVLAAAAQARTLKKHVFAWRVLHFSLVRLLAHSGKEESCRTNLRRKRDPTAKRKTGARAASESTDFETQTEHLWVKNRPKTCPKATSEGNLARRASWEPPGVDFGPTWGTFWSQNRSKKGVPKQA